MFTFALHVLPSYLVAEDDELYAMTRTPTVSAISFVPWNHVFTVHFYQCVNLNLILSFCLFDSVSVLHQRSLVFHAATQD